LEAASTQQRRDLALRLPPPDECDFSVPACVLVDMYFVRPLAEQVDVMDRAGAALFLHGPLQLLRRLEEIRSRVLLGNSVVYDSDDPPRRLAAGARAEPITEPSWPLNEVVTATCIAGYVRVHEFLVQLRESSHTLRRTWIMVKGSKSSNVYPRPLCLLLYEVSHFVNTIQSYIHWQV
jgi:hypothetical protein